MPTAIGVSGTPEFWSGGRYDEKELDVNAVLVCILRLEEAWEAPTEEKVLVMLWQGFINRRAKAGDEVIGATARWRLIVCMRSHR